MPPPDISPDETSPLLHPPELLIPATQNVLEISTAPSNPQTSQSFRIGSAMCSFAVNGLFQSSIGVMLPPLSEQYSLTDIHVSLIFLVGPAGYLLAAYCNGFIHSRYGQRGVAFLGPLLHMVSAILIAIHPPFPVVLVAFGMTGVGIGFLDGPWCAWAGAMEKASMVSGLLHGSFSLGAAAGPFIASVVMHAAHKPWYTWYYIMAVVSLLELFVLLTAFRYEDAARYRALHADDETYKMADWKAIFKHPATWVCAAYYLAYVGNETAISGWLVSYIARSRHATLYIASLSSSEFWAGMAVGRLALGFFTDRFGVRQATTFYFVCAILVEVLFTATKSSVASVVFATLMGFFMGPLFPSGIVVLTRLLPNDLHIAAVSFVASIGQVGGALLPFGIGALVDSMSIDVFPYAIIVFSTLSLAIWIVYARLRPKPAIEGSQEHDTGIDSLLGPATEESQ
ncbi:MFS transporter-like protein [Polyplosphaeria fusca]|uniref:MFS transporter-like protein n=1 Tax=Polyplosphaeria fusca TaxID=682080 RepID=A0A9P4QRM7_9PLEO|nr:MFS transporter-like protein [Polyplosphaeria fusca]